MLGEGLEIGLGDSGLFGRRGHFEDACVMQIGESVLSSGRSCRWRTYDCYGAVASVALMCLRLQGPVVQCSAWIRLPRSIIATCAV